MKKETYYSNDLFVPRPMILLIGFLTIFIISFLLLNQNTENFIRYLVSSFFLSTIFTFTFEFFLRKKFVFKLDFEEYFFRFKKYKFQYIDIGGFDFKDNKVTLYMKHFNKPIRFSFLNEDDANRVADILKQKHL